VKIVILAEGKLKDRGLRALVDEYLSRVRRHARCEEVEVKDSAALERAVPADCVLVALEVDGEALTSTGFSERLARWTSQGKGVVAFLIGGANGLPSALSKKAHHRISLSAMTLPHRLARLVLSEQLYRAISIQRGEPYARED